MRFLKDEKKVKVYQEGGFFSENPGSAQALIAAGGDFLQSRQQKKYFEQLAANERDEFKRSEGLYKRTLQELMDTEKYGREEMSMSPEMAEARDMAMTSSRNLVDEARNKGEQDTASLLNILESGDPAQAALAVSQLDDISGGVSDAQQKAFNMASQAQLAYGSEAARIDQANVGVRDDNRARLAALASLELQRGASGMDRDRAIQADMTAAGISPVSDAIGSGLQAYEAYQTADEGMKFVGDEGGVTSSTTDGEKFSHKQNPIHMIDEDGEKVGEMTGGEYVFNPDQSKAIKDYVDQGDAMGLMKYMDELFDEPQFA